jgi:hypothetical protein
MSEWRRRRDIIASKHGVGAIRIYDQINAYAPGHRVPAAEVREVFGVLNRDRNVSKGCAHHHCDIRAWGTGRVEGMDAVPTRVARRVSRSARGSRGSLRNGLDRPPRGAALQWRLVSGSSPDE